MLSGDLWSRIIVDQFLGRVTGEIYRRNGRDQPSYQPESGHQGELSLAFILLVGFSLGRILEKETNCQFVERDDFVRYCGENK